MVYLVRDQTVMMRARPVLTPGHFTDVSEVGHRTIWMCLLDLYDKFGFPGREILEATTVGLLEQTTAPEADAARHNVLEFFSWVWDVDMRSDEMKREFGFYTLERFLQERAVLDPLRRHILGAGNLVPSDLPGLISTLMDNSHRVTAVGSNPVGDMVPDQWGEEKFERVKTGVDFLDVLLDGGLVRGEVDGLLGAIGSGKCLGKGTPVLRYDGSVVPVEDIVTGDLLMGPDSLPRRVLSTATGREKMYKVRQIGSGDDYTVNESHILSLKCEGSRPSAASRLHQIVNLSVRDYMTKGAFFKYNHRGWRVGVDFPERQLPLDPYFLGVWLADGTTANTGVTTPDPEVVQCLHDIAADFGLTVKIADECGKAKTYRISGPKGGTNLLLCAMRDLGVIGSKHIPQQYLINSRKQRLALLAGVLDGDGYVVRGVGHEIVSVNETLADQIVFLARSLGLAASKNLKWVTQFGGKMYYRIYITGDFSQVPFRIPRRVPRKRARNGDPMTTMIKVEPAGRGDYYGFELDGDGLFLLGDFTVTHNTTLAVQASVSSCWDEVVRAEAEPGYQPEHVFFVGYEQPIYQYRRMAIATAADIPLIRVHPSTVGWEESLSTATDPSTLLDHDRKLAGAKECTGEFERYVSKIPRLSPLWHVVGMSGKDKDNRGAGDGYVDEIASHIERTVREQGCRVKLVVIDYALLLCDRYIRAMGLDVNRNMRNYINGCGDHCGRKIAAKFNCAVLLLHQLSGESNTRAACARVTHADSAEGKLFAVPLVNCLELGTKDEQAGCVVLRASKTRHGATPPDPYILRYTQYARLDKAGNEFMIDPVRNRIQPRAVVASWQPTDQVDRQPDAPTAAAVMGKTKR